jgi:hypothetical protein
MHIHTCVSSCAGHAVATPVHWPRLAAQLRVRVWKLLEFGHKRDGLLKV